MEQLENIKSELLDLLEEEIHQLTNSEWNRFKDQIHYVENLNFVTLGRGDQPAATEVLRRILERELMFISARYSILLTTNEQISTGIMNCVTLIDYILTDIS